VTGTRRTRSPTTSGPTRGPTSVPTSSPHTNELDSVQISLGTVRQRISSPTSEPASESVAPSASPSATPIAPPSTEAQAVVEITCYGELGAVLEGLATDAANFDHVVAECHVVRKWIAAYQQIKTSGREQHG
jgi:hypothetical protein